MKIFRSYSSAETKQFGFDLAQRVAGVELSDSHDHAALVIALQGDLGAGKTTFTQGFARGLGIRRRATSPTFVIMRRFALPVSAKHKEHFKTLYHIDAYRLKKPDALKHLDFKEILADPTAIVLIEWPERVKGSLPRKAIWLKFQHGKKENERIIRTK